MEIELTVVIHNEYFTKEYRHEVDGDTLIASPHQLILDHCVCCSIDDVVESLKHFRNLSNLFDFSITFGLDDHPLMSIFSNDLDQLIESYVEAENASED